MKTHILENNKVINTITATLEETQNAFPNNVCIDADIHQGGIGWTWNGTILKEPEIILTDDQKWENIRFKRDILLMESDIYVLSDRWNNYTEEKKNQWTEYRKSLRDIPQDFINPNDVIWPTKPN